MKNIPVALQLYSVRNDCAGDLPGVLQKVAAMGYDGVEFAGYHGHGARELRVILDGEGLKAAGTHTGLATLMGEELEKTVEFNREIGNRFLIVPGLAEEHRNSIDAWKRTAACFNDLAERVKAHGMHVGYHNHCHEFQAMEGKIPWDEFFTAADPAVVMQFDTGNAMKGGGDPAAVLRRYPGRALTVHLKEYAAANEEALIGEGDVPWQTVFETCETIGGTEWYVVEQESYPVPPLECAQKCLDNLHAMRS